MLIHSYPENRIFALRDTVFTEDEELKLAHYAAAFSDKTKNHLIDSVSIVRYLYLNLKVFVCLPPLYL